MSEEDNQIAMELNGPSGGADLEGMATEAAPIEDFDFLFSPSVFPLRGEVSDAPKARDTHSLELLFYTAGCPPQETRSLIKGVP